jgi:hypothetical protein
MLDGAVYSPLDMEPRVGLRLQTTAPFEALLTLAVNCVIFRGSREMVDGISVTATGGTRYTSTLADLAGSATLVAVTTIVWGIAIVAGAV